MKTCLSRERIEAVVLGEAPEALLPELEQHAEGCARCRHELSWLRSEVALFSQRAAREEVSRLWEGVAERRAERKPGRLTRALLGVAAMVLVGVSYMSHLQPGRSHGHTLNDEGVPMSLEMMSVDGSLQQQFASAEVASMPCYTPGGGFACE
jgi:hypothetical protein